MPRETLNSLPLLLANGLVSVEMQRPVLLKQKFYAVAEHQEEIDKKIEEKSNGWSLKRLAKADVTALRLAIYEILYDEDVPAGVAVNEAVELAKRFGTDKSPSYVNGVLGSVVRDCTEE